MKFKINDDQVLVIMVDLRLNSLKIRKVRISEKFCGHIFQRQKLTQENEILIFFVHAIFPRNFPQLVFFKFCIFQVNIQLLNFEFNFAIFRKLRGRKKIKISFFGSVFDTEKYDYKIFPKFELFGFFRN